MHILLVDHPGQYIIPRAVPNTPEDYEADKESITGLGMILRAVDFDRAFCKFINSPIDGCSQWQVSE